MAPMRRLLVLAAVAGLVSAGVALAARPAPRISGTDPVTGKHVSLAQFRGHPVVINVWASWCVGCNAEAADLKRFAEAHPEARMLGIDVEDSKAGARAFYRRHDQDWPSVFDPRALLASRLGSRGVPTTFFLDRKHRIVEAVAGAGTFAEFQAAYRDANG
jgi:thiol-disulfide isomerase/thioredoxin